MVEVPSFGCFQSQGLLETKPHSSVELVEVVDLIDASEISRESPPGKSQHYS